MWFTTILLTATCLAPLFRNDTNRWDENDSRIFTRALTRCQEKFERSPCLEKFYKLAPRSFRATCKDPFYFTRHLAPQRGPATFRTKFKLR